MLNYTHTHKLSPIAQDEIHIIIPKTKKRISFFIFEGYWIRENPTKNYYNNCKKQADQKLNTRLVKRILIRSTYFFSGTILSKQDKRKKIYTHTDKKPNGFLCLSWKQTRWKDRTCYQHWRYKYGDLCYFRSLKTLKYFSHIRRRNVVLHGSISFFYAYPFLTLC